MAFWFDVYYNRERRHSTIGYHSPIDYEQQFINTRKLTTACSGAVFCGRSSITTLDSRRWAERAVALLIAA